MRISRQSIRKLSKLIDQGKSLDPVDSESFHRWAQAAYEALKFDPLLQQRFDEYCRSSLDSVSMRLFVGVRILEQSLQKNYAENLN